MEYKTESTKYVSDADKEEPLQARANLGGLELKQFREIEGWLFDCGSGK